MFRPLSRSTFALLISSSPLVACGGSSSEDAIPDASMSVDAGANADASTHALACVDGIWNQHLGEPSLMNAPARAQGTSAMVSMRASSLDSRKATDVSTLEAMRMRGGGLVTLYAPRSARATLTPSLARVGVVYVEPVARGFHIAMLSRDANVHGLAAMQDVSAVHSLDASNKVLLGVTLPPPNVRMPVDVTRVDARGVLQNERRTMTLAQAREIAAQSNVLRIELHHQPHSLLDLQRSVAGVEEVQLFSVVENRPHYGGLTGRGINVAIGDTGVDGTHPDFHAYDADGNDLGSRVSGTSATGNNIHGSQVAGVVAGNGYNSDGAVANGRVGTPFAWRGMAPEVASIYSFDQPMASQSCRRAFATGHGYVSNHSHTVSNGEYSASAAAYDQCIHDGAYDASNPQPPRPVVFAAGNNGDAMTYGIPIQGFYSITAPMKNAIVVGGLQSNDGIVAPQASKGPTLDGRLKPDLVAPSYKDYRPLDGLHLEIDEVRIRAREGSGAEDIVWTLDEPAGSEDDFYLRGFFAVAAFADSVASARTNGDAFDGVAWFPIDSVRSIDASKYDVASMRVRLQVDDADAASALPHEWRVRWTSSTGAASQLSPVYTAEQLTEDWQTLEIDLTAFTAWSGTIRSFEWTPAIYSRTGSTLPVPGGGYERGAGTSMAAPVVTGVIALMMQQMHDSLGIDFETTSPFPSTFRALLVHTATDLVRTVAGPWREAKNPDLDATTPYPAGPDFASGYGLVNAAEAIAMIQSHDVDHARRWVEGELSADQMHAWEFEVSDSSMPLKATLAWDDLPSTPMVASTELALINDLDIVLIDPNGQAHSPWLLDPLPIDLSGSYNGIDDISLSDVAPARQCVQSAYWDQSSATCEDHRNNLEQVYVAAPMAGIWTMYVRAYSIFPDQTQRYSVAMSQHCASANP